MVERDIVYEVIPHYQRRRLHAKLAQVGPTGRRAGRSAEAGSVVRWSTCGGGGLTPHGAAAAKCFCAQLEVV
jgi:hypothetical protein